MGNVNYARRAYPSVIYKNKDIAQDLMPFINSFTIIDNLKDSLDDVDIGLINIDNKFLLPGYCLERKAQLVVDIITENWEYTGEVKIKIPCGVYYIDDRTFSNSSVSVKGISGPIGSMQDQKNSDHWENITLKSLAEEIAKKYDMELMFLAENLNFSYVEQENETDLSFLQKVVSDEGLALKINFNKVIIFDESEFEAKEVVRVFDLKGKEIEPGWQIREKTKEIYDACSVSFVNTQSGETEATTYNRDGQQIEVDKDTKLKILKLNTRSLSRNVSKYAQKQLKKANQDEISFSFTIIGDVSAMSGQTFKLINAGIFNGKYMISRVTKGLNPFKAQIESYKIVEKTSEENK